MTTAFLEITDGCADDVTAGCLDDVTAGSPDDVTAGCPDDVTAGCPDDVTAGCPDDVTAGCPDDITAGCPDDVTAGCPDDVTAGCPDDVTVGCPGDVTSGCPFDITAATSDDDMLTCPDEVLLPEIDLYLECIDDPLYEMPEKVNPEPHSLIGQNVQWKISFPSVSLAKEEVEQATFTCPECRKAFTKENLLKQHLVSKHGKSLTFACSKCAFVTKSNRNLQRHSRRVHLRKQHNEAGNPDPAIRNIQSINDSEISSDLYQYKSSTSPVFNAVEIHKVANSLSIVSSMSGDEDKPKIGGIVTSNCTVDVDNPIASLNYPSYEKCGTTSSCQLLGNMPSDVLSDFVEGNDNDQSGFAAVTFRCTQCEFACVGRTKSLSHVHKMLPLCCICCKVFTSITKLNTHKANAHKGVLAKQRTCPHPKCMQAFRLKFDLNEHMRTEHNSVGYTCDKCDKTFKSLRQLQRHLVAHTGLYVCTWEGCGKSFRDKFNLGTHFSTHTGSKSHTCPYCSYSCVQKASMNWHMKKKHSEAKNLNDCSPPNGPTRLASTIHVEIIQND